MIWVVIVVGFIGCFIAGIVVEACQNDSKSVKILAWIMGILIIFLSSAMLASWKQMIERNVILDHYQIEQQIASDTTYIIKYKYE